MKKHKQVRFIGLVVLACLVEAGLLRLAYWQWNRYQQRLEQQAEFTARPPHTLSGTWLPEQTFALVNQPNPLNPEAEVGWRILTPLQTTAGLVVVDRGYTRPKLKADGSPDFTPFAPAQAQASVTGVLQPFPVRKGWLQGPDTATHPQLLMFLNPVLITGTAQTAYVVSRTPTSDNLIAVPPPLPAPLRHLSYAGQWLGLAVAFPLMCGVAFYRRGRHKR